MASSKIVIVGAGPGLARAVAERFGGKGWRVVMAARNKQRLEDEAREMRAQGVDAVPVALDVTDFAGLDAFIRREAEDGGIDVLVYNAAIIRPNTPLLETSLEAIESDLMIDLGGALVAVRAAIPGMRDKGTGTILFSGGELGFNPWHTMLTLGASKAAMRNAAQALAADPECAKLKIAYVNIDAYIAGDVGPEIADLYWQIHQCPREEHEWDVNFSRPYEMPSA